MSPPALRHRAEGHFHVAVLIHLTLLFPFSSLLGFFMPYETERKPASRRDSLRVLEERGAISLSS
jgi:hypothetical protein